MQLSSRILHNPRPPRQCRTRILCLLLLLSITGCGLQPTTFRSPTDEQRQASFDPFKLQRVEGQPLEQYLEPYRALLVAGGDAWLSEQDADQRLRIEPVAPNGFDFSMAIPLTDDGYFLTAAHSVERRPLRLVLPPLNDQPGEVSDARLVWAGRWQPSPSQVPGQADGETIVLGDGNLIDVAVIHAPTTVRAQARWAYVDLPPGTPVVALGRGQMLGGRVFEIREPDPEQLGPIPVRWILHDVPVREGDSGGPLMLLDGRLIGMNVAAGVPVRSLRHLRLFSQWNLPMPSPWQGASVAVVPDPAALRRVIETDRRLRNQQKDSPSDAPGS